jgi:Winged helix-turn helix
MTYMRFTTSLAPNAATVVGARERATVRIDGGRIVEVGTDAGAAPPEGARTAGGEPPDDAIDLEGRTLLPGLIDAHAHVFSDASRSPGFGPPPALHGELPRPRELGYWVPAQTFDRKLAVGGELGRIPILEVVMRPPEVFVRSLSHQEAVRLKRMSTRAEHQSTRIRAAILLASNVRTPVPQIVRMWLTDESHVRKVIHEFNEEGFDSLRPDYRGGRPRRITTTERQRGGGGRCPSRHTRGAVDALVA